MTTLLACLHVCSCAHMSNILSSSLMMGFFFLILMTGSIRVALCLSLGTPEGSQLLGSEIQQSHNICYREWYFLSFVCQLDFCGVNDIFCYFLF